MVNRRGGRPEAGTGGRQYSTVRRGIPSAGGGGGAGQRCLNCGFGLGQFGVEYSDEYCSLDCFTSAKVTGRNLARDPRYGRRLDVQVPWPTGLMVEAPPSPKPWRGRTWSCESWRTANTANLTADGGDSESQDSPIGLWHGSGDVSIEEENICGGCNHGVEEFKDSGSPPINVNASAARVSFGEQGNVNTDEFVVEAAPGGQVFGSGIGGGKNAGFGGSLCGRENGARGVGRARYGGGTFHDARGGGDVAGNTNGTIVENTTVDNFESFAADARGHADDGRPGVEAAFQDHNALDQNFDGATAKVNDNNSQRRTAPCRTPALGAYPRQRGAFGGAYHPGVRRVEVRTLDVNAMPHPVAVHPVRASLVEHGNSLGMSAREGAGSHAGQLKAQRTSRIETTCDASRDVNCKVETVGAARFESDEAAGKSVNMRRIAEASSPAVLEEKKTESNRSSKKQKAPSTPGETLAAGAVEKSSSTQGPVCSTARAVRPTREAVRQWRHLFLL